MLLAAGVSAMLAALRKQVHRLTWRVRAGGGEPPCGISRSKPVESEAFDCSRTLATPSGDPQCHPLTHAL